MQALDLFEKILVKYSDDKDTQAYVALLKAIVKQQETSFEKLREIAPGFKCEVDLWLLQGQLREKVPAEHLTSLKCYLHAKDCIELKGFQVPAAVLSNIAILHHSLNKLDKALEYSKSALQACVPELDTTNSADLTAPIFNNSEFEDVFFVWSPMKFDVQLVNKDDEVDKDVLRFQLISNINSDEVQPSHQLLVGTEVLIDSVRLIVCAVNENEIHCHSGPVPIVIANNETTMAIRVKSPLSIFSDPNITYCYNFALILDDCGHTSAAVEVYTELLKRHPSFIECTYHYNLIVSHIIHCYLL